MIAKSKSALMACESAQFQRINQAAALRRFRECRTSTIEAIIYVTNHREKTMMRMEVDCDPPQIWSFEELMRHFNVYKFAYLLDELTKVEWICNKREALGQERSGN